MESRGADVDESTDPEVDVLTTATVTDQFMLDHFRGLSA